MATKYHVQMNKVTNGTSEEIYPITVDEDVEVTPVNKVPSDAKNLSDVLKAMGALAFKDSINIPSATTEAYGLTKLSNDTNSDSTAAAATPKAVSDVNKSAVKTAGDQTVFGMKTFSDGITIGNMKVTYEKTAADDDVITFDLI